MYIKLKYSGLYIFLKHADVFNHNGIALCLTYKTENFCVSDLAEYDDLALAFSLYLCISLFNTLLELENYRTSL